MNARQPWRPTPLITASMALHASAAGAMLWHPSAWPWWLAGLVADHAVLAAAGLWPRSRLLGPNWTRLPDAAAAYGSVAITIDDGPDPEVTPRVLDQLDAAGARATFFCIGSEARRHPALCREIVARGHAVENHSQHHHHSFSLRGPVALAREVDAAQRTLAEITGMTPRFFRAPAGLRNPFLEPVLHRRNLTLASWTRRAFDTRQNDPSRVLEVLSRNLAGGDILLLHDAHAARTSSGAPVILEVLPDLLAAIRQRGLNTVTLAEALMPQPADFQS
ncbi:polysaccharide deacetylase family protein [Crenobacter sp. SG2305]|uniref:polysaccharide deacetylase family protein n=1 Tax=Crenobacter oryzisoli TaxID=3056844 RepID=UPI0025AA5EEC|nr:polysaccharide deacetylase family protein [Crenobacter sp. SG2305]MDN0081357.1 polysaccharide deacetylase family protein [Crenobacter sp. SG2305]